VLAHGGGVHGRPDDEVHVGAIVVAFVPLQVDGRRDGEASLQ
jgi:hypothetical protein